MLTHALDTAGTVVAPDWVLPLAAVSCYAFPIMLCYMSGDLEKDRFARSLSGVTLRERAVTNWVDWLTTLGVLAEQPAASELG